MNTESRRQKYDSSAETYLARSYVDPERYMVRRIELINRWVGDLRGVRMLEVGCADGYMGERLARHGVRYSGCDYAPGMIRIAQERHGHAAENLFVWDMNREELSAEYDVIVAFMRGFYSYAEDPVRILRHFREHATRAVMVDLDPRLGINIKGAIQRMRDAGFGRVAWRPFFFPTAVATPAPIRIALAGLERVPGLRVIPLRWKFHVLLCGWS
jgi:hypothetical protein